MGYMPTNINTTKTINVMSNVLGDKIDATKKNMAKMIKTATGRDDVKTVTTMFPKLPGESGNDVVFIGLNGQSFYFKRGEKIALPEPLYNISVDCGLI